MYNIVEIQSQLLKFDRKKLYHPYRLLHEILHDGKVYTGADGIKNIMFDHLYVRLSTR